MFNKKPVSPPVNYDKIDTLIGKDTSFQGTLSATGTIRIDGEFKGEIKAKGDVVIGESGRVEAAMEARNVLIAGYIKGNIQAQEKIDLTASAKLLGDVRVKNIVIEEGAVFEGKCHMDSGNNPPAGQINEQKVVPKQQ